MNNLWIALGLFIILEIYSKYIEGFGDKCKKHTDCREDMYCDLSGNKICINKLYLGNTCNTNIECNYGFCDPITNRCKKIIQGNKCNKDLDCESNICDGSLICT
jgi:hypothetical protein